MSDHTESDSASRQAGKRDLLGTFFFYLHFVVMIYIVLGWVAPWRAMLLFYLVFVPAVYLQWQINKDTCILNNVEGWLRTGKWRNKEVNPEEGAWLLTLASNVTGLQFSEAQINLLTYSVLVLVWLLGVAHLSGWF